jgi:hypothetical protein
LRRHGRLPKLLSLLEKINLGSTTEEKVEIFLIPVLKLLQVQKAISYHLTVQLLGSERRRLVMPEKEPLRDKFQITYQTKSFFKATNECDCELEWEGKVFKYKRTDSLVWKTIKLAQIENWDVMREQETVSHTLRKQNEDQPSIALIMTGASNISRYKLLIPKKDFNSWLYWLLVSILKYSNSPVIDKKIEGLKLSRQTKLKTRRGARAFDRAHQVFVSVATRLVAGEKLPSRGEDLLGEAGEKFGKSSKLKRVGKGGQALVLLTKWKKSPSKSVPAIVKVFSYDLMGLGEADAGVKEARVLAALGEHPNIIGLIDVMATETCLMLFMEKGGPSLEEKKGEFDGQQSLKIALGILDGLDHMHSQFVYHLDIKPENILVSDDEGPKIIDFGFSWARFAGGGLGHDFRDRGTMGFVPPEQLGGKKPSKKIGLLMRDTYATGMTFLSAFVGPMCKVEYPPTSKYPIKVQKQAIVWIKLWRETVKKYEKELQAKKLYELANIALSMIHEDADKRLTVHEAFEGVLALNLRSRERAKKEVDRLMRRRKAMKSYSSKTYEDLQKMLSEVEKK